VDFLFYNESKPATKGSELIVAGEERLLAFVLDRRQRLTCVHFEGPARPIVAAVNDWRRGLLAGDSRHWTFAAGQLRNLLWKPLQPHVAGARTVLIAPDGILGFLPFATLPGNNPGAFLIEDLALAYVASGRDLLDVFSAPARTEGRGLLAAGGIDYNAEPGAAAHRPSGLSRRPPLDDRDRAGFTYLPGTLVEARHCREQFQIAFPREKLVVLTGAEAQEGRVKREAQQRFRYLHLATHGFFENPRLIAALRAEAKSPEVGPILAPPSGGDTTAAQMPLLHSGVVLAGAGRPPRALRPDSEDGILTAEEVTGLDLRGTEVVVLSACDTGLGRVEPGQGVLGLQHAFRTAGARALVASLWKVDDAATSLLMDEFYANLWQKKLPKLEALRQAQLTVLQHPERIKERHKELLAELAKLGVKRDPDAKFSPPLTRGGPAQARADPFYWAAFILSGDVR
jgi:CHAT domain-containing protein